MVCACALLECIEVGIGVGVRVGAANDYEI